jgi:hypothetical protein
MLVYLQLLILLYQAAADFNKMTKQLLTQQQDRAAAMTSGPSWRRSSAKK